MGLLFLKNKLITDVHDWDDVIIEDYPQQNEDSNDCGVFVMKAIEYLALDNAIDFDKEHIPRFRAEIATSIIRNAKVFNTIAHQGNLWNPQNTNDD